MVDGLKAAADLARRWAAKGREQLAAKRGSPDEVKTAFGALCTLIQARGFEALARALDAMASDEKTPVQATRKCPNCGFVVPSEWTPPAD